MLDRKQAEAAAEAVIADSLRVQAEAAAKRAVLARHAAANRRAAQWGLLGAALGSAVGFLAFQHWLVGMLAGYGVGTIVGRWFLGHRS